MKTLPIYTYGFDILRKKTKRIGKIDDKLIELVRNMFYTMHRANGIGLAAPQIGLDIALTVIDISKVEGEEKQKPIVLINPLLRDYHGENIMEEGCLSLPLLRAEVNRPENIYIEYQDIDLNKKNIELNGLMARVVQHEIDHLNGILFIDHLNKSQRKLLKERLDQIKNGEVDINYMLAEIKSKKKKTKGKTPLNL
ncbi:MAG: peptide deformylase [Ignavibacteria bacterium]